jgi:hypothetical protein
MADTGSDESSDSIAREFETNEWVPLEVSVQIMTLMQELGTEWNKEKVTSKYHSEN